MKPVSALRLLLCLVTAFATVSLQSSLISRDVYDDLVHYFKYATSAYSLICPWPNGRHLVESFKNLITDTQGFIARDDERNEIILALRGSFSVTDVITDAGIILAPFDSPGVAAPWGTEVHTGFLAAWNSVAVGVLEEIDAQLQRHPGYRLVAVGHSLGGALAALAALSLKSNFPSSNVTLFTYGQPRTGNAIFANWTNSELSTQSFRVVHTYDGVPTIIPMGGNPLVVAQSSQLNGGFEGYHHHGIEYWQNPDPASENTTRMCAADGEDPTCSMSISSSGVNIAHLSYFGIMAITPFCSHTSSLGSFD